MNPRLDFVFILVCIGSYLPVMPLISRFESCLLLRQRSVAAIASASGMQHVPTRPRRAVRGPVRDAPANRRLMAGHSCKIPRQNSPKYRLWPGTFPQSTGLRLGTPCTHIRVFGCKFIYHYKFMTPPPTSLLSCPSLLSCQLSRPDPPFLDLYRFLETPFLGLLTWPPGAARPVNATPPPIANTAVPLICRSLFSIRPARVCRELLRVLSVAEFYHLSRTIYG